ncbi:hypothetical protein TVAG_291950 [Trichomonas vaginalis G3]|uniref:DUF3447 domain-containing protein n=1 Tax=Trichomonas vaginalis (strain ATCC PRA-98 / G3) TaxID=412133 RepID=A2DQX5_TRIV3|nr:spectrin binding [Trichomonas vaginalis G3]EAY17242.1 hypothetical protein TVAG_291950 [Trichomonas vaginalis G3]KAI5486226.1 spectrin binding [Trichomonas vaginalis G3]|eukprot:XP_001329465.1 hypothetical protein [Trichomonas vaginalis G3]
MNIDLVFPSLKTAAIIEEVCFSLNKYNFDEKLQFLKSLPNLDSLFLVTTISQVSACKPYNYKLYADLISALNISIIEFPPTKFSDYLKKRGILKNYRPLQDLPIEKYENIFDLDTIGDIILKDDSESLLKQKSKVNLKEELIEYDLYELTLLDLAAFLGSEKCFHYLLQNGCEITEDTPYLAVKGGNANIIATLKSKNVSIQDCLICAIQSHNNEVTNELLQSKVVDDEFTLELSIHSYNTISFCYLLQKGHKITTEVLEEACHLGHIEIVRYILQNSKVEYGKSLFFAAENGFLNIIEEFLKNGADIQCRNNMEDTLLHKAAENGFLELSKFLVEHGIDPKSNNAYTVTPLDKAKENRHFQVIKFLYPFYK